MTETTPHHAPQASPTPPVAPKRYGYRVRDQFGQHFDDPWDWLRDGENPEVREHLEAENAWADAVTAPTRGAGGARRGGGGGGGGSPPGGAADDALLVAVLDVDGPVLTDAGEGVLRHLRRGDRRGLGLLGSSRHGFGSGFVVRNRRLGHDIPSQTRADARRGRVPM